MFITIIFHSSLCYLFCVDFVTGNTILPQYHFNDIVERIETIKPCSK